MKNQQLGFCGATLLSFAGCAHVDAPQQTSLEAFELSCMAPLLHALMITSNALPAEESKKENFKNYAYSFQDAKQSQEYVTCLERNRKAADFKKRYRSANQWLKRSREAMQNYKTHFTPNEQITDVIESYTDIDEAHGNHHVVVTRQDGTQVVIDTQFKKLPK